jgi:uroporphyrinogen decarboxylase
MSRADRFLRACRGEPTDCTPVWFMRQAGRYMPEYRTLRAQHSLLELCAQPELAAQVTLQPVTAFDVDAAILFSDILLPIIPLGFDLDFVKGEGPIIRNPLTTASQVEALPDIDIRDAMQHVLDTIGLAQKELAGTVPLIGFAGAPFTIASYLIAGGPSRDAVDARKFMLAQPRAWHRLMEKLATLIGAYLAAQIEAGAQAVQLFDSWVGAISPAQYQQFVLPYSRAIFERIREFDVPSIHFGTGTALLLPLMHEAGASVLGVDSRTPLSWVRSHISNDIVLQGNLDPVVLVTGADLETNIHAILDDAVGLPGHIFNTGHGILPETPVENVARAIELVHALSAKPGMAQARTA